MCKVPVTNTPLCPRFLSQATALYSTAAVVPANHVFFTTSAIMAGELSWTRNWYNLAGPLVLGF